MLHRHSREGGNPRVDGYGARDVVGAKCTGSQPVSRCRYEPSYALVMAKLQVGPGLQDDP